MPRILLVAVLMLAFPGVAQAACPGTDPCPYSASLVVGNRTGGVLRFPQAAAVGPDGSVYVADQYSHAIQVFGPDGRFVREFGQDLTSVGAVAVAADGTVFVADGSDRIDRYAPDGSLVTSWGESGTEVGEF